ncbi:MAG: hypothetical protein HQ589_08935 [Syntrophaceae bacterium]|nr:hypothetical protein [Syntrophaceae bacterium]
MLQKAEETRVVKYSVVEADIANMRSIYMDLVITDLNDAEQFKQVKEARLIVKSKRCAVEKERKLLNSDALVWQKKVNGKAKEIFTLIEPIETHLQAEEQKVLDEQERIKAEEAAKESAMLEKRFGDLFAVGYTSTPMELNILTDDEFQCLLDDKTFEFNEAQKAKADEEAAEKKRLADEAAARKAEAKRLADQKAEQDAKEAALKKQADELAAHQKELQDEKDRIALEEAEKKAAEHRKIKAAADAKAKAEKDAKDAEERELAAENEAKRKLALLPDKEKLTEWVNNFEIPDMPDIESREVLEIGRIGVEYIELTLHGMLKEIEEL